MKDSEEIIYRITIEGKRPNSGGWEVLSKVAGDEAKELVNFKAICRRFGRSYSTFRYRLAQGYGVLESLLKSPESPYFH